MDNKKKNKFTLKHFGASTPEVLHWHTGNFAGVISLAKGKVECAATSSNTDKLKDCTLVLGGIW
eukprot:1140537-Pelagomonas_calceolata.AAC.6